MSRPDLRTFARHAGLLLAGTLALLLLLEAGFRTAGLAVSLLRGGAEGAAQRTILAAGDSFTYGIGGLSFPAQLQRILDERAGKGTYRVVNRGVPGMNSALLAKVVEGHLKAYRPELLIVVVGEDNYWNTIRREASRGRTPWRTRLHSVLLHSRVYKFLYIMWIGLSRSGLHREFEDGGRRDAPAGMDLFLQANDLKSKDDCAGAASLYDRFIELNPDDASGYSGKADCLIRAGKHREAVRLLEKGIARARPDGELEMAYHQLGWAYFHDGDRGKSAASWKRGLERFPRSAALRRALERSQGKGGASPEGPREAEAVGRAFREDIRRISELAHAYGAKAVFSSYPDIAHPEVRETAAARGDVYVDLRPVFKERFKSREEYTAEDRCHCNTAGYRLMAEVYAGEVERLLK